MTWKWWMKIRLRVKRETVDAVHVRPTQIRIRTRPLRVLDFDCECRPLHWISNDYVSREITAIAWAWVGDPHPPTVMMLGEYPLPAILDAFVQVYNQADLVTGHYIRGFDLPLVNAQLTEFQMPGLSDKMAHDTKIDFMVSSGLSKSQENIGAMLGLANPKVKMNQQKWRAANRLEPEGIEEARARVAGDVLQHIEMRAELLRLGYLRPPCLWRSKSSLPLPAYTA